MNTDKRKAEGCRASSGRGAVLSQRKSGIAILITGSGKTAAALAMAAVLNAPDFDFSDAYIVSIGCSGGSYETTTLGDVVLVTAACDNELGHTADIREFADSSAEATWFYDNSYDSTAYKKMDASLAERIYEITKDISLRTTAQSQDVLRATFPGENRQHLRMPRSVCRNGNGRSDDGECCCLLRDA